MLAGPLGPTLKTLSKFMLKKCHYANVSVGTPSLSFLVDLDTGSRLFWLPCICKKGSTGCKANLSLPSIVVIEFNIYNPNSSSTSESVPCNSTFCVTLKCASQSTYCAYEVKYGSSILPSSSSRILVKDILHLTTDDDKSKSVEFKLEFSAIFDSGATFTYLNDSAYTIISTSVSHLYNMFHDIIGISFNTNEYDLYSYYFVVRFPSQRKPKSIPISFLFSLFNLIRITYIYFLSNANKNSNFPKISLTLKGGDEYFVTDPLVKFNYQ
ncbi:aspartyl protease family protein 1, partial [Quercus suber]